MFVLAHLSDPHLAPLPPGRLRELASKRLFGYVNWHRRRHRVHRRETLDALTDDLRLRRQTTWPLPATSSTSRCRRNLRKGGHGSAPLDIRTM